MNKRKKALSVILVSAVVMSLFGGCSSKPDTGSSKPSDGASASGANSATAEVANDFKYPMDYKGEPIDIFLADFFQLHKSFETADDSPFHQDAERLTGVNLNWSHPPVGTDAKQAFNLAVASSDLPDVLGGVPGTDVELLIADGVLIDLKEYLPKYAPNYWNFLQDPANDHHRKTMTTDNGQMGVFGGWREELFGAVWLGPLIRKDLLDKHGLEVPETIDDWDKVLETIKKEENMYMTFEIGKTMPLLASGFGAYGTFELKSYVDGSAVKIAQMQPEWKDYMKKMAEWYKMGYIDPDVLTNADAEVQAKVANDQAFATSVAMSRATIFANAAAQTGNGHDWVGAPFPSKVKDEPACTIYLEDMVRGGGIGITTAASEEQIEAACRFMDYFYTEDGNYFINFGVEGVAHTREADGTLKWSDELVVMPEGLRSATHIYTSAAGFPLGAQRTEMVKSINAEPAVKAVETWISNNTAEEHLLPGGISYTVDEMEDKATIESSVTTYIKEASLKFMTGDLNVDTEYDKFIAELEKMKVNDLIKIYQAGYDRFLAR